MSTELIDSTARIHPGARIAGDARIGPWCIIGENVSIGAGTVLESHVIIRTNTRIGSGNRFFQFCSIGEDPADKKFEGEETWLEIGDNNIFREGVTAHRGTGAGGGITRIGNNNLLMPYVHIAHDCIVGDNTVFANNAGISGHVQVGDWAVLGGYAGINQFLKIGAHAMVGGMTHITKDIPAFMIVSGRPAAIRSINAIGLERRGYDKQTIADLREAYKIIYKRKYNLQEAIDRLKAISGNCETRQVLINSLESSEKVYTDKYLHYFNEPGMTGPVRFGIVAGEKSGDILGASLISALRARFPGCQFTGVGGPAMEALGCESLSPMDRLSVMGLVEPLGRLPELLRLKKRLERRFLQDRPAAFIGIDSPDFNLRLAAALHRQGIKTVHYVSPSVWAYRRGRMAGIKQSIDLMLTLFPFESAIYEQHGVPVACTGHPLADQLGLEDHKSRHRKQWNLAADTPVITLMPGSRGGEIKRLLPVFLAAAQQAASRHSGLQFIIPHSGVEAERQLQGLLAAAGLANNECFRLVDNSHQAISVADFVITASGTATLEALLLRRPMVICYKLAPLSYAIASRLLTIPHVGLPNLLAGRALVPEYLQHRVTVPALAGEIDKFMENPAAFAGVLAEFEQIHQSLRRDAAVRAAGAITGLIGKGPAPGPTQGTAHAG